MQFVLDGTIDAQPGTDPRSTGRGDLILDHSTGAASGRGGGDLIALGSNGSAAGGAGADTYLVLDALSGAEVLDFETGADTLNLSVVAQFRSAGGALFCDRNGDGAVGLADLQFDQVNATTVRVTVGPGAGGGAIEVVLRNAAGLSMADVAQAQNFEFATRTTYSGAFNLSVPEVDGTNNDDILFGLQGNGSAFSQLIDARRGNDIAMGGQSFDVLDMGRGNDTAHGGLGNDTLFGGRGDDVLSGGDGQNRLVGNQGRDTFVIAGGALFIDTIADFGLGADVIVIDPGSASFDVDDLSFVPLGGTASIRVRTPTFQQFDVVAADGTLTIAELQAALVIEPLDDALTPDTSATFLV
jgi:Ca2+-binding RTX toxin-like protein